MALRWRKIKVAFGETYSTDLLPDFKLLLIPACVDARWRGQLTWLRNGRHERPTIDAGELEVVSG